MTARALIPAAASSWARMAAPIAAVGVLAVGVIPMGPASIDSTPDAILTVALNGTPEATNTPAPPFSLVDQNGRPMSLGSFHGRTVALTFLDPVCTSDCPIIAQQMRQADKAVDSPSKTAFVAIVVNPVDRQIQFLQAFDEQEHLTGLKNWYFLTGSLAQLTQTWKAYGIEVETLPGGGMVAHGDNAFVIDSEGHLRDYLGSDPGDSSAEAGSLAALVANEVRSAMRA